MSDLKNAPNLIVDRQEFMARNEDGTLSLKEMTEQAKEKNVDQVVRSQQIIDLHKRNAESKKARENEVKSIRNRTGLAQRSVSNMT